MWLVACGFHIMQCILNTDGLSESWAINYYPEHKSLFHRRLTNSFTVLGLQFKYPRRVYSLGVRKHTVGAYYIFITLELGSSQSYLSYKWKTTSSKILIFFSPVPFISFSTFGLRACQTLPISVCPHSNYSFLSLSLTAAGPHPRVIKTLRPSNGLI